MCTSLKNWFIAFFDMSASFTPSLSARCCLLQWTNGLLEVLCSDILLMLRYDISFLSLTNLFQHLIFSLLNFQILVDWTNGKNLILSSATPSVNEIRGPYDVANLSSLLGVSMERAKAAVSKNCRYESFKRIPKRNLL